MITIVLALIAGVASGLLQGINYQFLPGVLFGVAIAAGSFSRFAKVGPLRILTFTALSAIANAAAVSTVIGLDGYSNELPIAQVLTGAAGGFVGAAILAVALRLVFRTPLTSSILALVFTGTLFGGVFFLWPHPSIAYALWQGAIAAVIALIWADRRR